MEEILSIAPVIAGVILLLFNVKETKDLRQVKNFLDVLSHGSYKSCPYFTDRRKSGGNLDGQITEKKGGENL